MNYPEYLIIHTLAFRGEAGVKEVRKWHIERGFVNIGYHYLIRKNGDLETGRDERIVGAHCRGWNDKSIGIALEGHGDFEEWTDEQTDTFRLLACFLKMKHRIKDVLGHSEINKNKTCPGKLIDMDRVRELC